MTSPLLESVPLAAYEVVCDPPVYGSAMDAMGRQAVLAWAVVHLLHTPHPPQAQLNLYDVL